MEYPLLIEKYIQNRLSPEEELLFNELLETNTAFKEEVALHTQIKRVVTNEDDTNFRNLIADIESNSRDTPQKRSYKKWLVAASIVLIFGLNYVSFNKNTPTTQELFVSYFEPYRNVVHPIERGTEQLDKKAIAFTAYEKGEYEKAIILFTELHSSTKEPYYLFYKANALLQLEKAEKAIPLLLEHLKTKDTLTKKTKWYLALAYLKIEDSEKARKLLNIIISEGAYKNKEAEELLKKFE
jgi:FimV-like protein